MTSRAVPAAVFFFLLANAGLAQPKPNFSGTWKENIAKSDFGVLPGPESRADVITHTDPNLKVAVSASGAQGQQGFTANYTTDGREAVNQFGPIEAKSVVSWQGSALVISSKLKVQGNDVEVRSVWTLSADGNTMTQNVHLASAKGETDQKLVFEKQVEGSPAPPQAAPLQGSAQASPPAGPRPNLSGVWKLNVAKSDFGVLPAPESRTDTIEHNEPLLKVSRVENGPEGKREYVLNMSVDGKEVPNHLAGAEAKITSQWEGSTLVSVIKVKLNDQDITIKRSTTLSYDSKTMIASSHLISTMGEMDQKEVYEKQ